MKHQRPPGFPPGVPMSAAQLGGPPEPTMSMNARIIAIDNVQRALYNAGAILSQVKAQLAESVAVLSDTHQACKQTVDQVKEMDGPVLVGQGHISSSRFAERFELARQEDADAVGRVLELVKETIRQLPVDTVLELAERTPKRAP